MAIKDTTRKPFIEDNDTNVKIGIDINIVHLFSPKVVSGRINQFPISTSKDNVNIQHYGQYINQEKVFLDHQSTVDLHNVKPLEGLADVNTVENKTHLKFIKKNVKNFRKKTKCFKKCKNSLYLY